MHYHHVVCVGVLLCLCLPLYQPSASSVQLAPVVMAVPLTRFFLLPSLLSCFQTVTRNGGPLCMLQQKSLILLSLSTIFSTCHFPLFLLLLLCAQIELCHGSLVSTVQAALNPTITASLSFSLCPRVWVTVQCCLTLQLPKNVAPTSHTGYFGFSFFFFSVTSTTGTTAICLTLSTH